MGLGEVHVNLLASQSSTVSFTQIPLLHTKPAEHLTVAQRSIVRGIQIPPAQIEPAGHFTVAQRSMI